MRHSRKNIANPLLACLEHLIFWVNTILLLELISENWIRKPCFITYLKWNLESVFHFHISRE